MASFSNFVLWSSHALLRPFGIWAFHIAGQDFLNASGDGYFIFSGLFAFWRQAGLTSGADVRAAAAGSLVLSLAALAGAYCQLHAPGLIVFSSRGSFPPAALLSLAGLLSTLWAAHIFFVTCAPGAAGAASLALISGDTLACSSGANGLHHLSVGVACQLAGWSAARWNLRALTAPAPSSHERLALHLGLLGVASLYYSFTIILFPSFGALLADYVSSSALWCHHICVGLFCLLGSASHGSLWMVRRPGPSAAGMCFFLAHRDHLCAHVLWAATFSGVHAFGLLVHNDTVAALGRHFDAFADDSLCLRPVFALQAARAFSPALLLAADSFVCMAPLDYSTSDFLVCHIHAFSGHVTVFIVAKGLFYSRSSRFVASKSELGFRFPCDGPGRGGSCQVSGWDAIYLGLFWLYNLLSILLFSMLWKLECSLYATALRGVPVAGSPWLSAFGVELGEEARRATKEGLYRPGARLARPTSDFDLEATSVQGWLRDFLWAQSACLMQAAGSATAAYSLLFLLSHFVWSFSLMFLFSGRGYWQELIESLLWAHLKLRVVPALKGRALSIIQGRAIGAAHFIIGGVATIWAFLISKLLS